MTSVTDDGHAELGRKTSPVEISFCRGYITEDFMKDLVGTDVIFHTRFQMTRTSLHVPLPEHLRERLYIPLLYLAENHSNWV